MSFNQAFTAQFRMPNQLRLSLVIDEDQSCKLELEFQCDGFQGAGSAWFNLGDVFAFFQSINVFPLQSEKRYRLAGGYFNADGSALKEQHLLIEVSQLTQAGKLRLDLSAAVPINDDAFHSSRSSVPITYQELAQLSDAGVALCQGTCEEFILKLHRN
jgi:hypothetical protein